MNRMRRSRAMGMRAGLLARLGRLSSPLRLFHRSACNTDGRGNCPVIIKAGGTSEIVKRFSIREGLEWVEAEEVAGSPNTVRAA